MDPNYNCPTRSTYTQFYFCDNCDNIHIALRDSENSVYTECVLSDAMALQMVALILEHRKEYTYVSPPTQPDVS